MYLPIDPEPSIEEQELTLRIFEIKAKHPKYGYRRVKLQLRKEGVKANKKRVLRIMKENNLLCKKQKTKREIASIIKTAYITSKLGINIIRDFIVFRPYQVIQTDFTELATISGKYQLIVYLCQYTKKVLSWEVSCSTNTETVIKCVKPILKLLDENSYIHQDQGSAFTSNAYIELLMSRNVYISYSEAGTPTDNGEMESFFGRLKDEWRDQYCFVKNISHLKQIIGQAINYYNNERIHTTIEDTPNDFLNRELFHGNLSINMGA